MLPYHTERYPTFCQLAQHDRKVRCNRQAKGIDYGPTPHGGRNFVRLTGGSFFRVSQYVTFFGKWHNEERPSFPHTNNIRSPFKINHKASQAAQCQLGIVITFASPPRGLVSSLATSLGMRNFFLLSFRRISPLTPPPRPLIQAQPAHGVEAARPLQPEADPEECGTTYRFELRAPTPFRLARVQCFGASIFFFPAAFLSGGMLGGRLRYGRPSTHTHPLPPRSEACRLILRSLWQTLPAAPCRPAGESFCFDAFLLRILLVLHSHTHAIRLLCISTT